MSTETPRLPLFPLHAVLFPGGRLQLRIFEPRYLRMVRDCLRDGTDFGIVLIRDGEEVMLPRHPRQPQLMPVGTFAHIVDWEPLPGNRLGILVQGQDKFRITQADLAENYLVTAMTEPLPEKEVASGEVPACTARLTAILRTLMRHPSVARLAITADCEDARHVSCLLGQLLPISEADKYQMLILDNAGARLAAAKQHIQRMGGLS